MSVRIVDVREITKPISSPIRNAYIDFTKMTTSLVAVVTDVMRDGRRGGGYGLNFQRRLRAGRFDPRALCAAAAGGRPEDAAQRGWRQSRPRQGLGNDDDER